MTEDQNFQNHWYSNYAGHNLNEHFSEIRTYAYLVFDQLDTNRNGFIEIEELEAALFSTKLSEREKSFITFLLDNHESIAEAYDEGTVHNPHGISRQDIEAYFRLIQNLL